MSNRINCCSFCKSNQHNIKLCNDPLLLKFGDNLLKKKRMLSEIISIILSDKIAYFEIWINNQPIKLIKSYALRFCGAKSKNNSRMLVESIINYIWNIEINEVNLEVNSQINTLINTSTISFENNLIQNSHNYLDMELSEFLGRIRQDYTQLNESRKFNIKTILSIGIKSLDSKEECDICYEDKEEKEMITLNCNHKFCGICVKQILKKCNIKCVPNCALCREKIVSMSIKDENLIDNLKENLV